MGLGKKEKRLEWKWVEADSPGLQESGALLWPKPTYLTLRGSFTMKSTISQTHTFYITDDLSLNPISGREITPFLGPEGENVGRGSSTQERTS